MGILARLLPGNFTILTFELKKYIKNSAKSDYLAGKNTLFQAVSKIISILSKHYKYNENFLVQVHYL